MALAAAAAAAAAAGDMPGDTTTPDAAASAAGGGLAALLCACRLWRPLDGYLRLLRSSDRLHTFFGALAALRLGEAERAAGGFRAAVGGASPEALRALLRDAALPPMAPEVRAPSAGDEAEEWDLYTYGAAVWRAFKAAGDEGRVVDFATPTLRLPTLRCVAPRQCASLGALVFASALSLGKVAAAHAAILSLDGAAAEERAAARLDGAAVLAESADNLLRVLVASLHARGALHALEALAFPPHLAAELDRALLAHARSSTVSAPASASASASAAAGAAGADGWAPSAAALPSAYEGAYALKLRAGEYAAAAACLFEFACRLHAEWRAAAPASAAAAARLPEPPLVALVEAEARALAGAIGALELVPVPSERFVLERAPSTADQLATALHAHHAASGTAADGRGLPLSAPPAQTLFYGASQGGAATGGVATGAATGAAAAASVVGGLISEEESERARGAPRRSPRPAAPRRGGRARRSRRLRARPARGPPPAPRARARPRRAPARASPGAAPAALLAASAGGGCEATAHEAAALLVELLRRPLFDAAAALAASFAKELRAHAVASRQPSGLALVAMQLGAHCARLDGAVLRAPADADADADAEVAAEMHPEWERLRRPPGPPRLRGRGV